MTEFDGQTAVVTGAAQGKEKAISAKFVELGVVRFASRKAAIRFARDGSDSQRADF
jgi:NAD(P)-dependent dehydrogenase (short-subunit alcohol dehydrogenase family)